jgi:hypothetical protein
MAVKMIVQAKNMSEVNFGAVLEKIRAVKAEMENSVELMAAEIDKVKAAVKRSREAGSQKAGSAQSDSPSQICENAGF